MILATLLAVDPPKGGGASTLIIFLPFLALMYFFMIRPQRAKLKKHQDLTRSVDVGDEIETIAGMFGFVRSLDEQFLMVEFAPGTTIKMARGAVRRRVVEEPDEPDVEPDVPDTSDKTAE